MKTKEGGSNKRKESIEQKIAMNQKQPSAGVV